MELTNDVVRPMNKTEFQRWLERAGCRVIHIRRSPRGALRAFLGNFYVSREGKAHIAELSLDGRRVYMRSLNDAGREVLVSTLIVQAPLY